MTDASAQTATAETKPAARPADPKDGYMLVLPSQLPDYGIPYVLNHVRRLWKRGDFPVPLQISPHRIAWRVSDIKAWIDARRPSNTVEPKTATDDKSRRATAAPPAATPRRAHTRPSPRQQQRRRGA